MSKACGLVTSCTRWRPMNNCVCPLASVRTRCAFQTFRKRVSAMGLRYNAEMPRARLRYVFFTVGLIFTVAAAALSVAHGQGQAPGALRAILPASLLPAIDRGLVSDLSHAPGSPQSLVRE